MTAHTPPLEPHTELDARYSSPDATATPWTEAVSCLERAEIFWLSTVRQDGRPHVTPVMTVWTDGALHFTTGERERKVLNITGNPQVALTTGTNTYGEGCDLVVEGEAVRVTDEGRLAALATLWEAKYGSEWHFDVHEEAFRSPAHDIRSLVFRVVPRTAFGFGRGARFSQTRWHFTR